MKGMRKENFVNLTERN